MTTIALILGGAVAGGALAALLRLPPMVGFLAAGFALSALGASEPPGLQVVANAGVTLLLFAIGLKFNVRTLIRREVWAPSTAVLVLICALATSVLLGLGLAGVALATGISPGNLALIGLALAFSSTVLAVKVLEEQSLDLSLVGRTTIGILVVQDLAAVGAVALTHGTLPSAWALLLVALFPARHLLRFLRGPLAHPDLRPLVGVALAFGPGYALFESVGLKGDLGALVVGVLVGTQPGAGAMARSLLGPKDLLLVGFFLSIGFVAQPGLPDLALAAGLLLLVPIKFVAFVLLLRWCGLRRRTAVLTAVLLANYSEFSLIVAVALVEDGLPEAWLAALATAVAVSMALSSLISPHREVLVSLVERLLPERPVDKLHPDDRPIEVGDAEAVVLGMGRIGTGAYDELHERYGVRVLGVEVDTDRTDRLRAHGRRVLDGDATDPEFWVRLCATGVRIAVLAMPFHGHNLQALARLRESGFSGSVAIVAKRDADLDQALDLGAHTGLQIYEGAGRELANRAAGSAGLTPEG